MTIHQILPNDNYKPTVSKPSLQQYDNYQIYDIYCKDIVYSPMVIEGNINSPPPLFKKDFLAVQRFSSISIDCDFTQIASTYP